MPTNLSKMNQGHNMLTPEYAARIVAVVAEESPGFSEVDLGAPSSVVAEGDPTALDRLRELEEELARLRGILLEGFSLLDLEVDQHATDPRSPRVRRTQPQPKNRKR